MDKVVHFAAPRALSGAPWRAPCVGTPCPTYTSVEGTARPAGSVPQPTSPVSLLSTQFFCHTVQESTRSAPGSAHNTHTHTHLYVYVRAR